MPDRPSPPQLDLVSRLNNVVLSRTQLDIVLDLVTTVAKEAIPSARSVSVSLKRDGSFTTPAATDRVASQIDLVQYEARRGPCIEAAVQKAEILIRDFDAEDRWPHVCAQARAHGLRSVLSIPLLPDEKDEETIGGMNLYSEIVDGFDAADIATARALARQAGVLLANAHAFAALRETTEQLKQALETRDVIGQAKGILMEREGLSGDEAFAVLRQVSQTSNRKLREVAQRFVQTTEEKGRQRRR